MPILLSAIWSGLTSKAGGVIAEILAAVLVLVLILQSIQLHEARSMATRLQDSITAPVTGWSARLATCTSNATNLDGALKDQNAKVTAQAAAMAAKLAAAQKLAQQAEAGRKRSEALVAALTGYKTPKGSEACPDLLAADAAVQKALQ